MRFFLCLMLLSFPALADVDFLGRPKERPAPTQTQIDESIKVLRECGASELSSRDYDCRCVAAYYLDIRLGRGDEAQSDEILESAQKNCVNQPEIAGHEYKRCLTFAPQQRDDYESYCRCYANSYAAGFAKSPNQSIRKREAQMTSALSECNKGDTRGQTRARDTVIDWLKQTGIYRTLFPGATP